MSTVRPPHMGYILDPDLLQRSSFRGHCDTDRLGMSKAQIKAKHPPGTNPKHIDAMHKYMKQDGLSFQQAHNKAEASGFPALGSTSLGSVSSFELLVGFGTLFFIVAPAVLEYASRR